jgi:hypothetical protein
VLTAKESAAADKAIALCWLFHLAGDIHQPLHSAALFSERLFPKGDRGGNDVRVLKHGTMHSFWDGIVNKRPAEQSLDGQAAAIIDAHRKVGIEAERQLDFDVWMRESFELANRDVYTADIREQLRKVKSRAGAGVRVSDAYVHRAREIGERRIAQAGFRLAGVLKEIFSAQR